MVTVFRVHVTRWMLHGKQVKAGTPGASKVRLKSKKWYARLPGQRRRVPLSPVKSVALSLYADLLRTHERRRAGLHSDADDWAAVPLSRHLTDFTAAVRAGRVKARRPPAEQAVRLVVGHVDAVLTGTGAVLPGDLDAARVQAYLSTLAAGSPVTVPDRADFRPSEAAALLDSSVETLGRRVRQMGLTHTGAGRGTRYPRATVVALAECRRGLGLRTVAAYAADARRFTRWMTRRGRLAADPLAELEVARPEHDGRHQRRPLSAEESSRFLGAARDSRRRFRGLSGSDRWAVYLTAMSTGFRLAEVATLTPERFRLDDSPPVVILSDAETKNDRGAVQPLPAAVVVLLREYLWGRPVGQPVWPGTWHDAAAEMVRRDLAEAGIPYRVEGPDGPLFADFHALRHSFVAALKRAGVTLSQAMRLARHSDPRLTMAVYGREDLDELAGAASRISPGSVAPPVAPPVLPADHAGSSGVTPNQPGADGRKPRKRKGMRQDSPEREGK